MATKTQEELKELKALELLKSNVADNGGMPSAEGREITTTANAPFVDSGTSSGNLPTANPRIEGMYEIENAEVIIPSDTATHYSIQHNLVGSFNRGDIVPSSFFGTESAQQRLLSLGAILASDEASFKAQGTVKMNQINASRLNFSNIVRTEQK